MAMDSNYSSPMGEPLMEALEEEEEDSGPPTPFFDLLPPEPKGECSEQAQETVSIHVGSMFLDPVAALTCGEGPVAAHGWTVDQNATHQPPQEHVSSSVCCLTTLCVCVLQVRLLVAKDGQAFTNMLKSQKDFGNPELLDKVRGHALFC
jgi:hypothetical protein